MRLICTDRRQRRGPLFVERSARVFSGTRVRDRRYPCSRETGQTGFSKLGFLLLEGYMSDAQRPASKTTRLDPSRRNFVMAAASTAAAPVVARRLVTEAVAAREQAKSPRNPATVTLNVNGREH